MLPPRAPLQRSLTWSLGEKQKPSDKRNGGAFLSNVDRARASAASLRKPWFIIDPRTAKFVPYWDFVTGVALLFTATLTPYEVGFLQAATVWWDPWFIVNRVVDLIFLADFLLQFFLAYLSDGGSDKRTASTWIFEPRKIAYHYCSSFFFPLDVLSIGVAVFDWLELDFVVEAMYGPGPANTSSLENSEYRSTSSLKALRVLRALRLIKLVRLLRASRMLQRWEVRYPINYGYLSMLRSVVKVLLLAHFSACVWTLQTTFQESRLESWLAFTAKPYCYECGGEGACVVFTCLEQPACPSNDDEAQTYLDTTSASIDVTYTCRSGGDIYAASIYWAIATITSIGYGDITAAPGNTTELGICAFLMILSAFAWAEVVAGFVNVVSNLDPDHNEFRTTMDALNKFMQKQKVSTQLQRRLREYFHQTAHLRTSAKQNELMQAMSPALQAEVSWHINHKWLERVWFLNGAPSAFLLQLVKRIRPLVLAPSECAPPDHLYIINRGLALYGGKVLRGGGVYGEDACILKSGELRSTYVARAMTFLECFAMHGDDIDAVLPDFPDFALVLRKRAIRFALRRAFILIALRRRTAIAQPSPSRTANAPSSDWEPDFSGAAQYARPARHTMNDVCSALEGKIDQAVKQLSREFSTALSQVATQQVQMRTEVNALHAQLGNEQPSDAAPVVADVSAASVVASIVDVADHL